MNGVILDAGAPPSCAPLTVTRPLAACRVANRPLLAVQQDRLVEAGVRLQAAPAPGERGLFLQGDAWVTRDDLTRLLAVGGPASLQDRDGTALAWVGLHPEPPPDATVTAGAGSFRVRYPWDLLRINEALVETLDEDRIEGDVSAAAHVEGRLVLGPGSRLLPGVFIEGNVIIGARTKVGPNCYLRGCTSIGDDCHIGQAVEIKNAIVMDRTSVGHLSYCGDSILGERVNFGAGTITANFRHDGRPHRSMVAGALVDTGRRKFGTIAGDDVHTGIHTSIYPGRKLWPGVSTRPGEVVARDLVTTAG